AEMQPGDAVVQLAARGQHEDPLRHVPGPHSFQDLEAVHSRQSDVEHDEIERRSFRLSERRLAVVNNDGIVAGFGEGRRDVARKPGFVINYQNAHKTSRNGKTVLPPAKSWRRTPRRRKG